ncbi:hypothetical protein ACO0K1_17635 [Undibacterium sp. SXout20W]
MPFKFPPLTIVIKMVIYDRLRGKFMARHHAHRTPMVAGSRPFYVSSISKK